MCAVAQSRFAALNASSQSPHSLLSTSPSPHVAFLSVSLFSLQGAQCHSSLLFYSVLESWSDVVPSILLREIGHGVCREGSGLED